ncbi:MAG: NAD(P)-dependent glycerol-3-phosphate dehydrogenase [Oscillospiraceae bacterium]|nr:NAD(P)-dependent glycerol-3-phosphate dehydrogenase [Oscillospiraceae bacterium]MBQ8979053.1 NAD(P)-dependent glycerol-3-phosphate dehydrogenase [Oscillospiraceae bacterium]
MAKVIVLGSGGFGLAMALSLNSTGNDVTVWSAFKSEIDDIRRDGENKAKLPGVHIPETIVLTDDIADVQGKDLVVFGIPVNFVREVARKAAPYLKDDAIVVNTGKGLEPHSLKRMSEVITEETGKPTAVLTGPSHAEEVALGIPTTIVVAAENQADAEFVQDIMSSSTLRIYLNDDIVGCEIGGAFKNIIALCAGIADGMGLGDNTKAALMTRGIWEISKLGIAMGGRAETFAGLTGIGDLIVTCTSMHSRNRRAGILVGQGTDPAEAVRQIGTVEGYICAEAAYELSRKLGVCMPITEQCYQVLYRGKSPQKALHDLMGRPKRSETEAAFCDWQSEQ